MQKRGEKGGGGDINKAPFIAQPPEINFASKPRNEKVKRAEECFCDNL